MKRFLTRNFKLWAWVALIMLPYCSMLGTNWNTTYQNNTGSSTYNLVNGDTYQGAIFTTAGTHNPAPLTINISGTITSAGSSGTALTFIAAAIGDVMNINIASDTILTSSTATGPSVLSFSGGGTININITQGSTLQLGSGTASQAIYCIVRADFPPQVIFNKISAGNQTNSVLKIKAGSSICFGGSINDTQSNWTSNGITFNATTPVPSTPSSISNGVFLVKLEKGNSTVQGGSFDIEVVNINIPNNQLSIPSASVIDYGTLNTSPANNGAKVTTINTFDDNAHYSALVIENNNTTPIPPRNNVLQLLDTVPSSYARGGFILGSGGTFSVGTGSYVWYVGRANNNIPQTMIQGQDVSAIVRYNNPSALYMEGPTITIGGDTSIVQSIMYNPQTSLTNQELYPTILLDAASAFYFSSACGGLDNTGNPRTVNSGGSATTLDYLVPWYTQPTGDLGYGNITLWVYGAAAIKGITNGPGQIPPVFSQITTAINVNGAGYFPVANDPTVLFPQFTFHKSDGVNYDQYGKQVSLWDGQGWLSDITFLETDVLAEIPPVTSIPQLTPPFSTNKAAPWAMGGSTWYLQEYLKNGSTPPMSQELFYWGSPTISLWNSWIVIANNTGMASANLNYFVGDALALVPSTIDNTLNKENNSSLLYLYDGTTVPKYFLLGTSVNGAVSSLSVASTVLPGNYCNLDVCQTGFAAAPYLCTGINLNVGVGMNTTAFSPYLTSDFPYNTAATNPYGEVKTVGFGNISIGQAGFGNYPGVQLNPFAPCTMSIMSSSINIGSDVMTNGDPDYLTGYGTLAVGPMGTIEYFTNLAMGSCRIPMQGIYPLSAYDPDNASGYEPQFIFPTNIPNSLYYGTVYNNTSQQLVLASKGSLLGDVFLGQYSPSYVTTAFPHETGSPAFSHTPITLSSIDGLPLIDSGATVKRLLISSLNAYLAVVIGGEVGEITSMQNLAGLSSEPTKQLRGVIVLQDGSKVSYGPGNNTQSKSQTTLGDLGLVTYINGTAEVKITGDVLVTGTQQFCTFSDAPSPNTLKIKGDNNTRMIVEKGSLFDLTALNSGDTVILDNINLVVNPGSGIAIPIGVELILENSTVLQVSPYGDLKLEEGSTIESVIPAAAHFMGEGTITLQQNSSIHVDRGAFLSIDALGSFNSAFEQASSGQLLASGINTTNLTFNITDGASFYIGSHTSGGGSVQIGNPLTGGLGETSVSAKFEINGRNAVFFLGSEGFLGLGAGIVSKIIDTAPDTFSIGQLTNVDKISIKLSKGDMFLDQANSGDTTTASLVALGYSAAGSFDLSLMHSDIANYISPRPTSDVSATPSRGILHGGSNLVAITEAGSTLTYFYPIVDTQLIIDGEIDYQSGLVTSSGILFQESASFSIIGAPTNRAFEYLTMPNIQLTNGILPIAGFAAITQIGDNIHPGELLLSYVTKDSNNNVTANRVNANYLNTNSKVRSYLGTVGVLLNPNGTIQTLYSIKNP